MAATSVRLMAMVEFEARSDAERAVYHMNGGWLDGLCIVVKHADEKPLEEAKKAQIIEKRIGTGSNQRGRRVRDRSNSAERFKNEMVINRYRKEMERERLEQKER